MGDRIPETGILLTVTLFPILSHTLISCVGHIQRYQRLIQYNIPQVVVVVVFLLNQSVKTKRVGWYNKIDYNKIKLNKN